MTTDEQNRETSARERAEFVADPPARYFAYHKHVRQQLPQGFVETGDTLTTWTGDKLGELTERGRRYRSSFGDERQSFRAACINGRIYSGTAYLDAGNYVRMRLVKHASEVELRRAAHLQSEYKRETSGQG